MSEQFYDETYYREYLTGEGHMAYERNAHWMGFFAGVADQIVRRLAPATALDAGCAIGLLVEALHDRGVDAHGIDISEYAVSQAPDSVRDRVRAASLTDPIDGRYELVTCIEVIEHIPAEEVHVALKNLTEVTDQILLSSTPGDFHEPTHLNVQPPEYWAGAFSELGFHRDTAFDASFLSPWAALYRRDGSNMRDVVVRAERERWNLVRERNALRDEILRRSASAAEEPTEDLQKLRDDLRMAIDAAHAANARRASVESRLRHVDYALDMANHREAEMAKLIERLYEVSGGDAARVHALVNARTFDLYWKLLTPYRWLRDRR